MDYRKGSHTRLLSSKTSVISYNIHASQNTNLVPADAILLSGTTGMVVFENN